MKLHLAHTLLSCVLSVTLISSVAAGKCERLELYNLPFSTESVTEDLVTGSWTSDLEGHGSTLTLFENGEAEMIKRYFNDETYLTLNWEFTVSEGLLYLELMFPEGDLRRYMLSPTCDGFAARNNAGKSVLMTKGERKSAAELQGAKERILGSWRNDGQTASIADGDLQWRFDKDGTFALTADPDDYHGGYIGNWKISQDGERLVLQFVRPEAPEKVFATRIIKLHLLDFEDLVVSGGLLSRFTGSDDDDFRMHFEKAF